MSFTTLIYVMAVVFMLLHLFLKAFFLLVGLRWAKAEEPTYRKAIAATLIGVGVGLVVGVLSLYFLRVYQNSIGYALLEFATICLGSILVVKLFFGTSILRSIQALVPSVVVTMIALAITGLIFKPFLGETFIVPTNSMSPTILGMHLDTTCEHCGEDAYISAAGQPTDYRQRRQHCICNRFHSSYKEGVQGRPKSGDRILTAKFLRPERWEIATFKYPRNPKVTYVKRIVGLPGESIHIENGSVYANGQRLTPPDHLAEIVYSDSSGGLQAIHGTKDNPAVLGPDEYFALGDNTEEAFDSRHWDQGAPNHNAFAVPESYMTGVVINIYWPPERWRSFK